MEGRGVRLTAAPKSTFSFSQNRNTAPSEVKQDFLAPLKQFALHPKICGRTIVVFTEHRHSASFVSIIVKMNKYTFPDAQVIQSVIDSSDGNECALKLIALLMDPLRGLVSKYKKAEIAKLPLELVQLLVKQYHLFPHFNSQVQNKLFLIRDLFLKRADAFGCTALMFAARSGRVDLVKSLLELNPDVHVTDYYGRTVLMHAVETGKLEVAKLIISVDRKTVDARNDEKETVFDIARVMQEKNLKLMKFLSLYEEHSILDLVRSYV